MQQLVERHAGISVHERKQAEQGVQDTDAKEVTERTETGYPVFRIADPDGYGNQLHTFPGRKNEQGQFSLIAGSQEPETRQQVQRIGPETGLGVRQGAGGLNPEPEI